jgi:uncharacterized membrane protein
MSESPLLVVTTRLEAATVLDGPGKRVGMALRSLVGKGGLKDVLDGSWLGHPLHPLLTDLVIGTFISANVLDLFRSVDEKAAERLILIGLLAYPPTALSGASDWADSEADDPRVRRVGLLHAGSNSVAFGLYAASLAARRGGNFRRAKALGLAGSAVLGGAGYLGAHLSYARAVGVEARGLD